MGLVLISNKQVPSQSGQTRVKVYYLALTLTILIWGGSFIIINQLVMFATPLTVGTWRGIFSSTFFLCLQLFAKKQGRGGGKREYANMDLPRDQRRFSLYVVLAGLCGIGFFFPVQYIAIELVGPSIPALIMCLGSPIFMVGIAVIFLGEKITWMKGLGFILASFGAFLIITGGDLTALSPRSGDFLGNVLVLLTPVLWSLFSIFSKKAQEIGPSLKSTAFATHTGTMMLLCFSLLSQDVLNWGSAMLHPEFYVGILYISLGCSVYGYYAWSLAISKLPTGNVGSFLYVEPFITVLLAWVILDHLISPYTFLGGGIVLLSLILITFGRKDVKNLDSTKKL